MGGSCGVVGGSRAGQRLQDPVATSVRMGEKTSLKKQNRELFVLKIELGFPPGYSFLACLRGVLGAFEQEIQLRRKPPHTCAYFPTVRPHGEGEKF